ncbi:MAG: DUF4476 domain-containing protein [Deltaproteobacteria bacterium]|nr:DUF4476 domain-containing protein [Deltaproteobacteria bacterium]
MTRHTLFAVCILALVPALASAQRVKIKTPQGNYSVEVDPGTDDDDRPAPAPAPAAGRAMGSAQFDKLVAAIEKTSFDEKKLIPLRSAASANWFTAAQVGRLVDLFSFGQQRLKCVEIVRGRIVDPENNFTIYEHFTFSSEKDKAQKILEGG